MNLIHEKSATVLVSPVYLLRLTGNGRCSARRYGDAREQLESVGRETRWLLPAMLRAFPAI
jgi:hypothetical protein